MGLYDILEQHNMNYKELTDLIHELGGCVFLDTSGLIRQLDEIYDDEEFKRDFALVGQNVVWLVRKTQPCDGFDQFTIGVFDTKEKAQEVARKLNNERAVGVKLTDEGDFIEQDDEYCDWDSCEFYDICGISLNSKTFCD